MASFGFGDDTTAFGAALAEAVQESGVARLLSREALSSLGQALVQRVTFATPCALTSSRRACPRCHGELSLSSPEKKTDPMRRAGFMQSQKRARSRTDPDGAPVVSM